MAVRSAPDTDRSETARRGTEIYERDIKPTLGEDQDGRYVAIDGRRASVPAFPTGRPEHVDGVNRPGVIHT